MFGEQLTLIVSAFSLPCGVGRNAGDINVIGQKDALLPDLSNQQLCQPTGHARHLSVFKCADPQVEWIFVLQRYNDFAEGQGIFSASMAPSLGHLGRCRFMSAACKHCAMFNLILMERLVVGVKVSEWLAARIAAIGDPRQLALASRAQWEHARTSRAADFAGAGNDGKR